MKKIIAVCIAILMTASMVGCNASQTISEVNSNITSNLNSTGELSDEEICKKLSDTIKNVGGKNKVFIDEQSGEVTLNVWVFDEGLDKDGLLADAYHYSDYKRKAFAKTIGWDSFIETMRGFSETIEDFGEAHGIYQTKLAVCEDKVGGNVYLLFTNGRLEYNILW